MSAVFCPPPRRARVRKRGRRGFVETGPAVELTDLQWAAVAPLLPPGKQTGRRRSTDLRRIVTAIDHHWRTGCPWRKLPPGFPPWPTVYTYFRNWVKDGTVRKLRAVLNPPKPSEVSPSTRQAGPPAVRFDPDREPSAAVRISHTSPKPR